MRFMVRTPVEFSRSSFRDLSEAKGPGIQSPARMLLDSGFAATRRPGMTALFFLHPCHIELRPLAGAVAPERAVLADRVGALKDPVLPRRQPREDFRFHGFGTDEAQVGLHAG